MTKHLKDMTLDELKAGYEKGKVTDEEIEQHLVERLRLAIREEVKESILQELNYRVWVKNSPAVQTRIQDIAEHEYQKLKDNE